MTKEELAKLKVGDIVTVKNHDGEFQVLETQFLGTEDAQVFIARPEELDNRTLFGFRHIDVVTVKVKASEAKKSPEITKKA